MPKLPAITGDQLVKALLQVGFVQIRQERSHVSLWRERDNQHITVPVHRGKMIGKGLLNRILKDIGLTVDDLKKLL